ncbi:MAG: hypothetical protein EBU88_01105 [Acidobacteria bacterium]|nr:hypothetical protein [Acidobacteriota bacterium]
MHIILKFKQKITRIGAHWLTSTWIATILVPHLFITGNMFFGSAAQAVPGQGGKVETGERTGRVTIRIPVQVEVGGQSWETGIRNDFRVFINDQQMPVRNFSGPGSPTIFLVIFDTVDELSRVEQARTILAKQLRELPPNHWVGILRSQDGLRVIQEPTGDRDLLVGQIQTIQVNGKAGLLDTLQPVAGLATGILSKSGARVCVLYITDSAIGNYRADYLNPVINSSDAGDLSRRFSDRAVQEQMTRITLTLAKYTVPIFILHLNYRSDSLNLAYQSGLERIAAGSGGRAVLCRTVDEIEPGLDSLLLRMKSTYFLGADLPAKSKSTMRLRVEASLDGNGAEKVLHPLQVERERGGGQRK